MRRPSLVERLAADDAGLALLIAPPGYGKSSLLREWSEHDDRPFIWLSPSGLRDGKAMGCTRPAAARGERVVLAVDDAHRVDPAILTRLVETALDQLPAGSTVALACRAEPELRLGRLRAHRELVELREAELALTPPEVGVVLSRGGLQLDAAAVEAISQRTEGWAVGAYLAALSLRADPAAPEGWRRLGGSDHLISEYFRDEVLSGLPSDVARFMISSSVLEELSGVACDAVLDRQGSGVLLAALARQGVFLRATDAAHERFRWHGMFRETLQAELRRTQPEQMRELHSRASAWLYDRGDVDGAIDHAVGAEDATRAGNLLTKHVAGYLGLGRADTVRVWLDGFSRQRIADEPRLALAAAHTALVQGDTAQAQRWAFAADAGTPAEERLDRAGIALIQAMSPRADVAAMQAAASHAYDLAGEGGQWRPLSCLLRGVALYLGGAREPAVASLDEGVQHATNVAPVVAALCLAQQAMIAVDAENRETSLELSDRAVAELERGRIGDQPISALVFAAAAAARADRGRTDEAKRELRHAMDLLTKLGDFTPWYGAETRLLLARASLRLADVVRARALLAEASRLTRRCENAVFKRWFEEAWEHIDTLAETSLSGPSSLTIAELRILRFLPSHRSFKEIAIQLGVSANTVKTQAHAVYRKLGAASRSEAVTRAAHAGLLGQ